MRAAADPHIGPERMGPEHVLTDSTLRRLPVTESRPDHAPSRSRHSRPAGMRQVSILGRDPRLTTLEVDGTAAGDLLGGVSAPDLALAARPLAVEALQRLDVQPAPYDVRYGSSSAGTVEATTRSGTNRFEGSASGYYHLPPSPALGRLGSRAGQRDRGRRRDDARRADRPRSCRLLRAGGPPALRGPDRRAGDRERYGRWCGLRGRGLHPGERPAASADPARSATASIPAPPIASRSICPAANLFAKITWQPRVNSRLELSHAYDESTVDFLSDSCRQPSDDLLSHRFPLRAPAPNPRDAPGLDGGARRRRRERARPGAPALHQALHLRRLPHACSSTLMPACMQAGANEICGGDQDVQHLLELTDDVTLGLGAHRLTLGTHAERVRISLREASVVPLNASVAASRTSTPSRPDDLPATRRSRRIPPGSARRPWWTSPRSRSALYAQDQVTSGRWRATAGLRADVAFGLRQPTFNPTLLDSLGLDNRRTPGTHVQWAPRVGLSYDVRGDGRSFLRGGLGWFGGRPPFGWFAQVYGRTGLEDVHIVCEGDAVPAFTARARGPADGVRRGRRASPFPAPVVLFDPSFRSPYAFKTSIGSDARLPGGIVLTTDVVYIRGGAQLSLSDRNLLPPGWAAAQARPVGRSSARSTPPAGVLTSRRTAAFERVVALGSRGRDRSLAFSLQAEKRLGNGATLTASYTYTDARDFLSATQDDLDAVVDSTTVESPLEHSLRPIRLERAAPGDAARGRGPPAPFRPLVLLRRPIGLALHLLRRRRRERGRLHQRSHLCSRGYPGRRGYQPRGGGWPRGRRARRAAAAYQQPRASSCAPSPVSPRQPGRLVARNSCRNPWWSETQARVARAFPARPALAHAHRRRLQPAEPAQRPLGASAQPERSGRF